MKKGIIQIFVGIVTAAEILSLTACGTNSIKLANGMGESSGTGTSNTGSSSTGTSNTESSSTGTNNTESSTSGSNGSYDEEYITADFFGTAIYNAESCDGNLIEAANHLEVRSVYDSLTYIPEMFYGDHAAGGCYGGEYSTFTDDLANSIEYTDSSFIMDDEDGYYTKISVLPVDITAGEESFFHNLQYESDVYWAKLRYIFKSAVDGKVGTVAVAASYEIDGDNIIFHIIKSVDKDDDAKTVTYEYYDKYVTYQFSFNGPVITLTDGSDSIELLSYEYTGVRTYFEVYIENTDSDNRIDNIHRIRIYYAPGSESAYCQIYDLPNYEYNYNEGVCVFGEDGLMKFSYTDKLGDNHAYEFVYFDLCDDGLILADGENIYYYFSEYHNSSDKFFANGEYSIKNATPAEN